MRPRRGCLGRTGRGATGACVGQHADDTSFAHRGRIGFLVVAEIMLRRGHGSPYRLSPGRGALRPDALRPNRGSIRRFTFRLKVVVVLIGP